MSNAREKWEDTTLGSVFNHRKEKGHNEEELLSVTGSKGVVRRDSLERRDTSNKDKSKYLLVEKGDIVYNTMRMWQGVSGVSSYRGIVSPAYTVCSPTEKIDSRFAGFFLKDPARVSTFMKRSQGLVSDTWNLKYVNFAQIRCSLPPLPEQKKIAEILSGIDHSISAISKKQKKIKLILSQLIMDATTPQASSIWRETTIGENVDFQGGSQPPRSTFKFVPEEGYIRMLQIRDYKSDSRATYIPLDLCRRLCDKEDVMIGRYGPPNFQILRGKEGSYNVALIKAIPKNEKELKKEYLFRFLQRRDLFLLMDALSQRTSGQQGLDMNALKEFPISLPDPSMQEHICKSLAAIESIALELQHREQSLVHLKSGISDQLLSGRKRVNV